MFRSLILFLFCSIGICLFAEPKLGSFHWNKDQGFGFQKIDKWKEIPVPPKENYVVEQFQSEQVNSENLNEELKVIVFNTAKRTFTGSSNPHEKINHEKQREESERLMNFDEFLEERFPSPSIYKRYEILWEKGQNERAQIYEIYFEHGNNSLFYMMAGTYRTGLIEYVLLYIFSKKDVKNDKDVYLASLKSFTLTREATGIKKEIVDVTQLSNEERREAVKKNLPPGWYGVDTKNYVILTNVEKRKLIEEIAQHLELIRLEYERLFPPERPIDAMSVVRVCANLKEYYGYGAPEGSAGYFSSESKELVIYDDSKQDKKNTFAVLYHECFHQYTYYYFGELSAHRWYDEGLGDYFAGASLKEGEFSIKKFQWRTETIRNAVNENKHYPLEKFVRLSQAEYYQDSSICYAQGWAFIYFLRQTVHPQWKNIIHRYIQKLQETKDAERAVDQAFEGVDFKVLNATFEKFIRDNFQIR